MIDYLKDSEKFHLDSRSRGSLIRCTNTSPNLKIKNSVISVKNVIATMNHLSRDFAHYFCISACQIILPAEFETL